MSDWKNIENEFNKGKSYKDYAPEGEHKTTVSKVELVESSQKKTPGITFFFADNEEYSFPRYGATHWASKTNVNWRKYHNRELFREIGLTKDQAEKTVDLCESKGDLDKIMQAYLQMFEKAIAKGKEVDVVVFKRKEDDKYTTIDFANNNVRMNKPETEPREEKPIEAEEVGEEITEDELPF